MRRVGTQQCNLSETDGDSVKGLWGSRSGSFPETTLWGHPAPCPSLLSGPPFWKIYRLGKTSQSYCNCLSGLLVASLLFCPRPYPCPPQVQSPEGCLWPLGSSSFGCRPGHRCGRSFGHPASPWLLTGSGCDCSLVSSCLPDEAPLAFLHICLSLPGPQRRAWHPQVLGDLCRVAWSECTWLCSCFFRCSLLSLCLGTGIAEFHSSLTQGPRAGVEPML